MTLVITDTLIVVLTYLFTYLRIGFDVLWFEDIDREFVTSAKKSRILTNFPKLKKFVKIRTKIRYMPEWAWPYSGIVSI